MLDSGASTRPRSVGALRLMFALETFTGAGRMQDVQHRELVLGAAVRRWIRNFPGLEPLIRTSEPMMAQWTPMARSCRWCREILFPLGRNHGFLTKSKFFRDFNAVGESPDSTCGGGACAGQAWPKCHEVDGNATV